MNKYRKINVQIILIICFVNILLFSLLHNNVTANEKELTVGCLYFKNIFEKNNDDEYSGYAKDYLDELEKISDYKFKIILGSKQKLEEKFKKF